MRKTLCILGILAAATVLWAAYPFQGQRSGGGFFAATRDADIHTTFELVDADTGFTPLAANVQLVVAYAGLSWYDSLATGNGANLTAAWALGNTQDETGKANFLNFKGGSPGTATAVFGNGYSNVLNSYLGRGSDSDFRLGTANWSIVLWARSAAAANPSAVQTVFSLGTTPDELTIDYNTSGQVVATLSDDAGATTDQLTHTSDTYDANWHQILFQRRGSTLYLNVDGSEVTSTAVSNAAAAIDPDSVWIGAFRGTQIFKGRIDQVWIKEDSTLSAELMRFGYKNGRRSLGNETDTARVLIRGIKSADSLLASEELKVPLAGHDTTVSLFAYQAAWADTVEEIPLIVWSSGSTPRQAKRDSISSYAFHLPKAVWYFPKRTTYPRIHFVQFEHLSPTDTSHWELRVYHDLGKSRNMAQGYEVKARARLYKDAPLYQLNEEIEVTPGGFVAVFSRAASGSLRRVTGQAILSGAER